MRRAVYRRSAYSSITKIPPRLTSERTASLVITCKTGTIEERRDAVNELILGHIGFAGSIAARFAAKVPNKNEDILALSMYILVESTHRIAMGELMTQHDNYDAYMNVVLSREIQKALNADHTVRPPVDNPTELEELRKDPEEFADRFRPRSLTECKAVSPAPDRGFEAVLQDIVYDSQCFSSREREIIEYRLQGLNDTEIAKLLKISKEAIRQTKENMRRKLERLTGEKS